jgi:hypothetical protein
MLFRRSYLDLSVEQRRASAKVVKERLLAALRSPSLTELQQSQIQKEMARIKAWESGTLHLPPVRPPHTPTGGSVTDPVVTVKDAEDLGLCGPGVQAWARAHGVDPEVGVPASVLVADPDRRAAALGRRKLHEVKGRGSGK